MLLSLFFNSITEGINQFHNFKNSTIFNIAKTWPLPDLASGTHYVTHKEELFPSINGLFVCSHCNGLPYTSQSEDSIDRMLNKLGSLEGLGADF